MGLCLYVDNEKQAYIPVNHTDLNNNRLSWQLTEQDCYDALKLVIDNRLDVIMHNGKFDYQVLKCTCGIEIPPTWDTLIAAKLIDENEKSAGLKEQYISKIDSSQEKYSISHLFKNIEYKFVDPNIFALYAATDSLMTDKLYLYQKNFLCSKEYERVYKLFTEVEMPCVQVTAEMELNGILFDKEFAEKLKIKYNNILAEIDKKIDAELASLKNKIIEWRFTPDANIKVGTAKSKSEQLEDPINLGSPLQLAILLYDVLKVPMVSKKTPRGTGEDCLEKIDLPLCKLLIERRGIVKLLDAFILSLPEEVNAKTGKIHCNFNQYGAATGRFSSSEPNLQQIPSHEKTIRMLFKADPGYKLIGSDFSQQEVRLLAELSKDSNLIKSYKENKDIYATVAAGVYNMDYWDCMEHHEDGTPNPEGKKRRASCKSIVLGIMYSRGANAIAEQIGSTKEEAQDIINNFYKSFPQVKSWMDESLNFLKTNGYVEDFYGRRRRLPDINLPKYKFKYIKNKEVFNPFLICDNRISEVPEKDKEYYTSILLKCRSKKEREQVIAQAKNKNLDILDNAGFIAQAERQCVNARIQGSASTMTKIAMNKIYRDPELRQYGFKLLIGVHDELIGECKEEYAEVAANRLCTVMKNCVADKMEVSFKCDPSIVSRWYEDEFAYEVQETYKNLCETMSHEDSLKTINKDHPEFTIDELNSMLQVK